MKKIIIVILCVITQNIYAQNFGIGIYSNLIGGEISEPFSEDGDIKYHTESWSAIQLGLCSDYILYQSKQYSLKGSSIFAYTKKSSAFYKKFTIPNNNITNPFEYSHKTSLNYFYKFGQALFVSYSFSNVVFFDLGMSIILDVYEYEDFYSNYYFAYTKTLDKKEFIQIKFSPITQVGFNISEYISINVGCNYYFSDDLYEKGRISLVQQNDLPKTYNSSKTLNRFNYFAKIIYAI